MTILRPTINKWFISKKWHDDVIKWKHFPRYWPFVRGIHRSPVTSPHKGQWHGALMFLWSASWANGWVNNRKAGDLRRHRALYDVIVTDEVNGIVFKVVVNRMDINSTKNRYAQSIIHGQGNILRCMDRRHWNFQMCSVDHCTFPWIFSVNIQCNVFNFSLEITLTTQ